MRTFAAVNVKNKRHIASWLLLAVFVPMLILSSVHVHRLAEIAQDAECVHHQCHGHLVELTPTMHACVLCQFVSLTYTVAIATAIALVCTTAVATVWHHLLPAFRATSGCCQGRAPPFLL